MRLSGKLPRWMILSCLLALGVLLIGLPHYFEWKWDHGISNGLGEASR